MTIIQLSFIEHCDGHFIFLVSFDTRNDNFTVVRADDDNVVRF